MSRPAERTDVLLGRARPPTAVGLRRVRLVDQLVGPHAPRLSLIVAPAGCGKTTLLSHVAEAAGPRLAWLTLEPELADPTALLAHLRAAFAGIPGLTGPPWHSTGEMVNALDGALPDGAVLVIDELQTMAGTPSLEVIRGLLAHQPAHLTLVFGGRSLPELGLSRHRLTSSVRDIGPDDLRFRTWEVEELFRTCHDVRLGSDEVARLAQRTAGWAAGLQLFHLATTGRPQSARQTLLAGVGGGRLTSQYLAEQILAQLPADLRDFVLRSSVLDRLSPDRCNLLLEIADSGGFLIELDRSGLLDSRQDLLGGWQEYRYHEVLQTHLLHQIEARLGSIVARDLHQRAGQLWRAEAAHADAVRSFCRAQDWDAVQDVIAVGGHDLADDRGNWLDMLPATMHQSDPWVALAMARRLLSDGSLAASIEEYGRAITNFGGLSGTEVAARELRSVRAWVDPPLGTIDDPYHLLRISVIDPRQVPVPTDRSPIRWSAHGMACLVSGRLAEASSAFDLALRQPGLVPMIETFAALGHALTLSVLGDTGADEARRRAGMVASAVGLPALERWGDGLIRLLGRPATEGTGSIDDLLAACRAADDIWGEALLLFFATMRGLASGRTSVAIAHQAAEKLTALPAPALAAWASAAEAIAAAKAGTPWERDALARLERSAAMFGPVPHALALAGIALSSADAAAVARARQTAAVLLERSPVRGWVLAVTEGVQRRSETVRSGVPAQRANETVAEEPAQNTAEPSIRVEVLGGCEVTVDGRPVSTSALRPLHRELFTVFAVFAGQTVQRDQLLEWFWQGSDPVRAQHSLQVAVSELRRLIDPSGDRNAAVGIRRDGTGYRLQLPAENCDVRRMEQLVREAAHVEPEAAMTALDTAVALYRGDLVPEIGYPEWILAERDRLRLVVSGAYETLMTLRAAIGDHRAAVIAARAGLAHDRHRDSLWRRLVTSLLALDEPAAAAAAQRSYEELLTELGVSGS